MLFGFAGLTATNGSTSLLTKFVPGPPTVQLANGLRPETSTGLAAASASPAAAKAAIAATPAVNHRETRMEYLLEAGGRRVAYHSGLLVSTRNPTRRPSRGPCAYPRPPLNGDWIIHRASLGGPMRPSRSYDRSSRLNSTARSPSRPDAEAERCYRVLPGTREN